MKIQIGETMKKLRKEKGMTQSELAEAFAVTSQSVSRWENGQSYPDIEQIPMIADYFQVTVDELMGRSGTGLRKLEEELRRIRREEDRGNIEVRRKICGILRELASENPRGYAIEYFRETVYLHRDGFCWERDVEDARELCRQVLETCSGERIPTYLVSILLHEDEDKIGMWQEYITTDSNIASWHDILQLRYFALHSDKWEKQRQTVLYETIQKAIYVMANDIPLPHDRSQRVNSFVMGGLHDAEHYRKILGLIDLFSAEENDVFLPERIFTEIRLAAALVNQGNTEEVLNLLDTVREHLSLMVSDERTVLHASVSQLELIEANRPSRVYNAACEICMTLKRLEFNSVRKHERFCMLADYADHVRNMQR